MPSQIIQWFPGHMAKTRRLIAENLSLVDLVIEVLDARIPASSRNPEIAGLTASKPRLTVLTKVTLADPAASDKWRTHFAAGGEHCLFCDCISGAGLNQIPAAVKEILSEKLERYDAKGMTRDLKAMVVGVPNVGKSSLINRLAGQKKAKVENRPGVTLTKQWIKTTVGLDLLDMPGVLWPKFEDPTVGENLAVTGAIKDDILDVESIAMILCRRLRALYPNELASRYKLGDPSSWQDCTDFELLELVGRKRGFLVSGGEIDTERTANMLLDEFRAAKIGRMTLELPAAEVKA